jgi:hypothetical protein
LKSFFLHGLNSWVDGAFLNANRFPRFHSNPGQACHGLTAVHFLELAWPKSLFLRRRKFGVRIAFVGADLDISSLREDKPTLFNSLSSKIRDSLKELL